MPTVPNDNRPDHASPATQPEPANAASLTDAEANRQFSHGEAPHAVDTPEADQAPHIEEAAPDPAKAASDGEKQTVKVGARDVVRPSLGEDDTTGDAGSLADRLAKKDNTPSDDTGGSSGLS